MNTRLVRFLAALTVTATVVAGCGDDSAPSAESSAAVTTASPATTAAVTAPPTTAAPATTAAPTSTAAPTTAAPTTTTPPATWVEADVMPSLAYIPCCASNYSGEPSPPIPTDGSAPLAPGIYHALRSQPADGEAFDPGTIDFALSPFVACGTPDVFCEEGFVDGDVGVGPVAREIAMPLTDDVRVVVSGFACTADGNFAGDIQGGTGTLLATLQAEFEAAYAETVAPLVEAETPFQDYETLFATPVDGFSVPCLMAGPLQWQGSAGPALLMQVLGQFTDDFGVAVPPSISIEILHLTAYEVGADGTETLYFYAGFLS